MCNLVSIQHAYDVTGDTVMEPPPPSPTPQQRFTCYNLDRSTSQVQYNI